MKKQFFIQTKYGRHLAVFEPDGKRGYIVTVPGLEGAITWGENLVEAKKMVKEVIELCVECLAEEFMLQRGRRSKNERVRTPIPS